MYKISNATKKIKGSIELTASKSESNRALIIKALCKDNFKINNLASAQDTQTLQEILLIDKEKISSKNKSEITYDVGPAGTAMRFLTAYFSTIPGNRVLTGSDRMKQRPIKTLVDALRKLGATIYYLEEEGYPPLRIEGKLLKGGEIEMEGNISSQFISALLLASPAFKNGLVINFKETVTSRPYINMTLKMMEEFDVFGIWDGNSIIVSKQRYKTKNSNYIYHVEGDWSAASYWYAFAALADEVDFRIKGLKETSLQGDAMVAQLFNFFNIQTSYSNDTIHLTKTKTKIKTQQFGFDFSDCPDLAQTLAVVVGLLNIPAFFTGLHTLRIKETDRVLALKNELAKTGVNIKIVDEDSIEITTSTLPITPSSTCHIKTYEDHRMAMAFSLLAIKFNSILIEEPNVVKKSYPYFWKDLKKVGFKIEEVKEISY
jgi:3-phosphoshikimate 1-carboxyvinyltransferase